MQKKLVLLTLFMVLLGGCTRNVFNQETYNVSGRIVKNEDHQPLGGVKLLVNSTAVETNAQGEFKILGLKGSTTITPILDGWKFEPRSIEVKGKQNNLIFTAYNPTEETVGNIKISFIGSYDSLQSSSVRPLMHDREHFPFSPEIYLEQFQKPGKLVERYSPHKFVTSLNSISAYSPGHATVRLFQTPSIDSGGGGFGLPVNVDLAVNPNVIDASYILERGKLDAEALLVQMGIRNEHRFDGLSSLSEVHVDLGQKYKDVIFANELPHFKYGTTHVFELADLVPLENRDRLSYVDLVFGSYITESYILNPDGSQIPGYARFPWEEGNKAATLLGYAIHLPGFHLEFEEGFENHLIFSWNLTDLIEVYDNNSDDPSDHLITLRLDDPFPIELFVEKNIGYMPLEIEQRPAEEVVNLEGIYYDLLEKEIILSWLNPSDLQFDKIHVIRKMDSAPTSFDDGELVYSSNTTLFKDREIEAGNHYFYRIFTQSHAGIISEGVVTDVVSNGQLLDRINIEMWSPEGYFSPEVMEIKIGENSERLRIFGYYNDKRSSRIVADWFLEEDIGTLSLTKGEVVEINAKRLGEVYLTAVHSSGLEARILIKVID